MKFSQYLHQPEYIQKVAELDFLEGRAFYKKLALDYLAEHKDYYTLIEKNLKYFGLASDKTAVENCVKHLGYHYHEKFLSFIKEPEFYPDFLKPIIKPDAAIEEIKQCQEDFQPVIIVTTHYGAMPVTVGVLNSCGLDISCMVRFPSEEFKKFHETKAKNILRTLNYGRIKIYDAEQQPMMKIIGALDRGQTLFTVLDEHTPMNINVKFLGKTITGGSGVDQIVKLMDKNELKVFLAVNTRVENSYKLDLIKIDVTGDDYIQDMFTAYEKYVAEHPEQWFFAQEVHENIPE